MSELSYRTFVGFLILLGCLGMTFAVHASGKKCLIHLYGKRSQINDKVLSCHTQMQNVDLLRQEASLTVL